MFHNEYLRYKDSLIMKQKVVVLYFVKKILFLKQSGYENLNFIAKSKMDKRNLWPIQS